MTAAAPPPESDEAGSQTPEPPWSLRTATANGCDLLRLLLALLVVYSHCYPPLYGPRAGYQHEWISILTHGQTTGGRLAVEGFFALSGFLILHSWERSAGPGQYLWKRALRIYPAYLLCAGFCLALAPWSGVELTIGKALAYVFQALRLKPLEIHGAFAATADPGLNGATWTIQYEAWCYLILAGLGAAGVYRRRWGRVGLIVATLALVGLYGLWCSYIGPFRHQPTFRWQLPQIWAGEWPRLLAPFMVGTLFYIYRMRIPHHPALAGGAVALLMITAALGCWWAVSAFCLPYLLFWAAFHPRLPLRELRLRGRRVDLSYGLYLYAFPVRQSLVLMLPGLSPATLFALNTPIALALALASWTLVEAPALRLKSARGVAGGGRMAAAGSESAA